MSMITATAWVRRGIAAPFPTKYNFDDKEFQRIAELAKLQLDDANEDLKDAQRSSTEDLSVKIKEDLTLMVDKSESGTQVKAQEESDEKKDDDHDHHSSQNQEDDNLKEYDLEHYDDDLEDGNGRSADGLNMFSNIGSLVYYENSADDPYITIPEDEDDEERQDLQILTTDNLVLAAKVEDEVAHLEIYIYEDDVDNLYVHHDIMLPAIPLCVEWLDLAVGKSNKDIGNATANFVAVGTLDPDIEIWDLDTIDCMYPNAILGKGGPVSEAGARKEKKKKKRKAKKANHEYHVDAVLSLAANRQHRNLIASSSADKTVKLWDLNTTTCAKSYSHHTDKVCSIQWHAINSTVLLSGSYDRSVVAADMRAPDSQVPRWEVESDVEVVKWDPHDSNYFYISTEGGTVHCHDVRQAPSIPSNGKPLWILQAHDKSVSAFDINPVIPGFMATGSSDKQVKLWNLQASGPSMVVSRDLSVGKVFSTSFAPDEAVGFRLAVAGSKGTLNIWDTSTNSSVRNAFAARIGSVGVAVEERMIGIQADSSDESEDNKHDAGIPNENTAEKSWESMDED